MSIFAENNIKMKVIFLDIDGVMNSNEFYEKRHSKRWLRPKTYYYKLRYVVRYVFNGFKPKYTTTQNYKPNPDWRKYKHTFKRLKSETDKQKWSWLAEFCNANDFKICISSVWKNHFEEISDWNRALIALGFKDGIFVGITGNRQTIRGDEIKDWIANKEIDAYAILDDDSDMLPEQMDSFFFVDRWYGLSPNHLYRIYRHFNNIK